MHHGIEILLARMESHPEDFVQGAKGTWLHQIDKNKKYFSQEEGDKIKEKLREINLDQMTQNLMESMVEPEPIPPQLSSKPTRILASHEMVKAAHEILKKQMEAQYKTHIEKSKIELQMKNRYNTP